MRRSRADAIDEPRCPPPGGTAGLCRASKLPEIDRSQFATYRGRIATLFWSGCVGNQWSVFRLCQRLPFINSDNVRSSWRFRGYQHHASGDGRMGLTK